MPSFAPRHVHGYNERHTAVDRVIRPNIDKDHAVTVPAMIATVSDGPGSPGGGDSRIQSGKESAERSQGQKKGVTHADRARHTILKDRIGRLRGDPTTSMEHLEHAKQ